MGILSNDTPKQGYVLSSLFAFCAITILVGCVQSMPTLHSSLVARAGLVPNTNKAKNVILFIGDGMGMSTITAARIFDGQTKGMPGESNVLVFEAFPHTALIRTYNTNQQVPDSAGTATAMMSGQKTRAGVIGVGPESDRGSCNGTLQWSLPTFGELAEQNGKSTGIVTTTRITDATPATVYAHASERDWESDGVLSDTAWQLGCRDIAFQLVNFSYGDGLDVVLGGGRREFFGAEKGGQRRHDKDDLVADWLQSDLNRAYVTSADELKSVQPGIQVLGIFAEDNLTFMARRLEKSTQPTLSEMTAKAIRLLSENDHGYFLMVEGGRIDHGHHEGRAGYALAETLEFARAIEVALELVDVSETLILVTADHSHTLTISGYPTRGNPILGLVTLNDETGQPKDHPALAGDGVPFTTLGYMNGPGAVVADIRPTPETGLHAKQQSLYQTTWRRKDGTTSKAATHAGEDVVLFATGPWSHLVGGVLEQNAIFHLMTHAFAWSGEFKQLPESSHASAN